MAAAAADCLCFPHSGDGDFSFSAALAEYTLSGRARQLVATSYDSKAALLRKYGTAAERNLLVLGEMGAKVKHGVDAGELQQLRAGRFSHVIFNFPHTGEQRIHLNRMLLSRLFASVRSVLLAEGEVHVTLKQHRPYTDWQLPERAADQGFRLLRTTRACAALPARSRACGCAHQRRLQPSTLRTIRATGIAQRCATQSNLKRVAV
eukprot:PLAT6311.1.p2 GENE.PLAT6311.1~~PLAT6311.1.p2  ORF type:complete len:206 (-),score=68.51 PLAT6311.1:126-743(-)